VVAISNELVATQARTDAPYDLAFDIFGFALALRHEFLRGEEAQAGGGRGEGRSRFGSAKLWTVE
jgi:hypothetical protein